MFSLSELGDGMWCRMHSGGLTKSPAGNSIGGKTGSRSTEAKEMGGEAGVEIFDEGLDMTGRI